MILTYLCFLPDSLAAADIIHLIKSFDLKFRPTFLRTDQFGTSQPVRFSQDALEKLKAVSDISSLELSSDGESVRLTGMAGWPTQLVVMKTLLWPDEKLIEWATGLPGFSAAMVGDAEDVFWQSAEQINTYEVHGREWHDLPTVRDEIFGREKIDISTNPGRQTPAPGMWLWAASKMWFGPGAFSLLDRDALLSLPVGTTEQRVDGVVVVELYDLGDDLASIRSAQQAFRDWLQYDELEHRSQELAGELQDPRMEIETGTFSHGGVRRITEWIRDGKLSARSKANRSLKRELDEQGVVVWQEETSRPSD